MPKTKAIKIAEDPLTRVWNLLDSHISPDVVEDILARLEHRLWYSLWEDVVEVVQEGVVERVPRRSEESLNQL